MKKIILASASPRRKELLGLITPDFTVQSADADETIAPGTAPIDAVEQLSRIKAEAVWALQTEKADCAVIGADTIVFIDGEILGKPHCHEEALAMIHRLSGRTHTVCTGVTVMTAERSLTFHQQTEVTFYPLSEREIQWYCSLAEPYDKAGAYGIQGAGAVLIEGINGDYFNVMGLPVAKLFRALRELEALGEE